MMSPKEINERLKKKKITQLDISKTLDVTQTAINLVINKKSTSKRIQDYICIVINETFEKVFGDD